MVQPAGRDIVAEGGGMAFGVEDHSGGAEHGRGGEAFKRTQTPY
jgi:hypothetical protein